MRDGGVIFKILKSFKFENLENVYDKKEAIGNALIETLLPVNLLKCLLRLIEIVTLKCTCRFRRVDTFVIFSTF